MERPTDRSGFIRRYEEIMDIEPIDFAEYSDEQLTEYLGFLAGELLDRLNRAL